MSEAIEDVKLTVLRFPVSHYLANWRLCKETWHLIAFAKTEEGVIGIGEGTPYGSTIIKDYKVALKLAEKLRGEKIEHALETLRENEYHLFDKDKNINFGAFLALESALLSCLSKLENKTVAETLGGLYRKTIPVAGTVFLKHPQKMVEEIHRWIAKGISHVKIKIPGSINELENMLKIISEQSTTKNGIILRADANGCFKSYETAYKGLKIMEKYGVNIVEQPMPRKMLKEIAKLRKNFTPAVRIMLDESLTKPQDIEVFASMEAADIVNFHPSKLGCLSITRESMLKAEEVGLEVQIGSALMTEIGLSHYLSLAASLPQLDHPLEEIGLHNFYEKYTLVEKPPPIMDGKIILADGEKSMATLNFHSLSLFKCSQESYIFMTIKTSIYEVYRNLKPWIEISVK